MKIIGECIHVISPRVRAAMENRDETLIRDLVRKQEAGGTAFIDLNIGPSKKNGPAVMDWIVRVAQEVTDLPLSLDTTNALAMEAGLKACRRRAVINSISGEPQRMESMLPLAAEYGAQVIALTLTEEGIPPDASGRTAVAMDLLAAIESQGVAASDVYFDPLILPVNGNQDQFVQALESVRMFKELSDPAPRTTVGLSNISNSAPAENRGLINRIALILLMGAGLDTAIADPTDAELMETVRIVEQGDVSTAKGQLLNHIFQAVQAMEDIDPSVVDMKDAECAAIFKTAQVLQNKFIYAHSYLKL